MHSSSIPRAFPKYAGLAYKPKCFPPIFLATKKVSQVQRFIQRVKPLSLIVWKQHYSAAN